MKIVIMNDFAYINGGAGQVAISSAIALSQAGHQVFLFTAVGPIDSELLKCKNLQIICLNQHDILNDPNRLRAIITGLWNRNAAKRFEELLHTLDRKKTIVHIHTCSKALSSSCVYVANKLGFKILYHLHDYGAACPNLGFYNYQGRYICSTNSMSVKCWLTNCDTRSYAHKLWRCMRQLIQTKVGGLPSRIKYFAAVSIFSYNILQHYLPSDGKVFFVANPINVSKRHRVSAEKNELVIFIGRLTPEKNPVLLAKVAAELKLPVVFIGEGSCRNEIKNVNPNALVTGWLSLQEVQQYMSKARVLVLTSSLYETQGLVVLEAAALGIPAIVPHTCAAKDYIIDNESGLIFISNNEKDLKIKLIKAQNDNLVEELGKNAYDLFWGNPKTMNTYIDNIITVYKEVLSN